MRRQHLRRAYVQFCGELEPNVMLTLATNQHWSIPKMTQLLKAFSGRLDDWALGHTWAAQPPSKRADGMFFIEHSTTNIHAHGLLRLPYQTECGTWSKINEIWNRLCPSGTTDFQHIHDLTGAADYCTKEMASPFYKDEQIVLLADFMSPKSLAAQTN